LRNSNGLRAPIAASTRPKVTTIAAPVGKSKRTDRYIPIIETTTPTIENRKKRVLAIWFSPSLSRRALYSAANFTWATP